MRKTTRLGRAEGLIRLNQRSLYNCPAALPGIVFQRYSTTSPCLPLQQSRAHLSTTSGSVSQPLALARISCSRGMLRSYCTAQKAEEE